MQRIDFNKRAEALRLAKKGLKYKEIGAILGLTRQRAWQLVNEKLSTDLQKALDSNSDGSIMGLNKHKGNAPQK